MTQVADLLTVLHDIDRLKGRSCRNCKFWHSRQGWISECDKGMAPLDANDGCDHFKDKHADRNAKLTALVVGSLCLMVAIAPGQSAAFESRKWAQVDPDTREWFRGLHNERGTSCCDTADGVRIEDPDWRQLEDGSYEVFARDHWNKIRNDQVLKATNRVGYAILWWPQYMDSPTCFMPGARG